MTQPYVRRNAQQWQQIFEEHTQSGLPQQRFCELNDIAFSTFHSWRKRLEGRSVATARGTVEATTADFVEIPRAAAPATTAALPLDNGLRVRIELGAGVVLELSRA